MTYTQAYGAVEHRRALSALLQDINAVGDAKSAPVTADPHPEPVVTPPPPEGSEGSGTTVELRLRPELALAG